MFTKSSLKMKRNFSLCQLYQTGDCKKEEHTHPEIVREIIDGSTTLNTKILLHMCDICSGYRNAYPQHAGFECEFIQDLQDREKDPEYKARFMKKKQKINQELGLLIPTLPVYITIINVFTPAGPKYTLPSLPPLHNNSMIKGKLYLNSCSTNYRFTF